MRTQEDVEIDLIVERPGKPLLCIEIKSSSELSKTDISSFISITKDMENMEAVCICNDEYAKKIEHVALLPWKIALQKYFCV